MITLGTSRAGQVLTQKKFSRRKSMLRQRFNRELLFPWGRHYLLVNNDWGSHYLLVNNDWGSPYFRGVIINGYTGPVLSLNHFFLLFMSRPCRPFLYPHCRGDKKVTGHKRKKHNAGSALACSWVT